MRETEIKTVKTGQYTAQLIYDYFNERLRIDDYKGNVDKIIENIEEVIKKEQFTKVIIHAKPEHFEQLLSFGYQLEAVFKGFRNGADCYAMALYKKNERRISTDWVKEDEILTSVYMKGRNSKQKTIPDTYEFRRATEKDAVKLATIYDTVFEVYPTPMNEPDYVKKMMKSGSIFHIVEYNQEIVSAASADINKTFHHAELTDCATLPEHRKYGFMKKLLSELENELRNEQIFYAFSIARSLSFGMNAVFYQLGYDYTGRMTNNCYIYNKLEDMNVWVKDLSK
ncbi:putative beta-lysine N-acetyltransferase [Halalkalibacter kiskunsagensis]|uniref:Beta-lysine N-acetyltransferase n=1 Tax=Halalkalibacter kiskunsagensis TaxID=1548599 RepID=A0ABV6KC15_9BACI